MLVWSPAHRADQSVQMRHPLALTTSLLLAGSLLAACGDDDTTTTSADVSDEASDDMDEPMDGDGGSDPAAEGARQVEVVADSFAFDPGELTAEVGEDLTIVLTSEDLLHDLTIDELDTQVVADRGETAEAGLRADEAGEYTFYCSVPGHREAGMEGTLVVG